MSQDDRIQQLVQELAAAAPRPPEWDDLAVAPIHSPEPRGRGWQLAAAALVLVVGVAAVALVLAGRNDAVTTTQLTPPTPTATVSETTATTVADAPLSTTPATAGVLVGPSATVEPTMSPSTAATSTTTSTTVAPGDPAVETVRAYLADLAAGRFDEAAVKLAAGENWRERPDLAPLTAASDDDRLADALAAWCAAGALCQEPAALTGTPAPDGSSSVAATFGVGDATVVATFTIPAAGGVSGLPPLAGTASLAVIGAASDATTVVARTPAGELVTWHDGRTVELGPSPGDHVWSDGAFLVWETYSEGPDGPPAARSTAATLDGAVVCEVEGNVHRVRQRPEGGYVASVQRPDEIVFSDAAEHAVPNYAVDCEDGSAVAIDPVSWQREGGSRSIERIGDRTFEFDGDAEGNADVTNESGVSINGDDYAGYHTFSADGGLVAYGWFPPGSPSALVTDSVRGRDTTSGELLWSHDFDVMFGSLHHTGEHVVVALPPPSGEPVFPPEGTGSVVVVDARSGDVVVTVPTALDVIHVS